MEGTKTLWKEEHTGVEAGKGSRGSHSGDSLGADGGEESGGEGRERHDVGA